jgi:hypothetical protein|tara:strand:+ start:2812 stop:3387 length:576 start_codon:yes stop_codon:yes gene_type:complete
MDGHDSPITINKGSTTIAKALVSEDGGHWPVPEGTILASGVRRVVSFVIDYIIVSSILLLITGGDLLNAWNLDVWMSSDFHYSLAMLLILLISHWLYWKYTGLYYSRSFGQKLMGLAVLAEDGSEMTSKMWEQRAFKKLRYMIFPFSIYFGSYDLARISQRHTHQSNIDLHVGSIVAHANSLPPANRKYIR